MRQKSAIPFAALVVGLLYTPALNADVKLPAIFSDGMVLQQGFLPTPIWGTADPGEKVEVIREMKDKTGSSVGNGSAVADKDGKWLFMLPGGGKAETGAVITLTIKGKNTITIKNVLYGEVWIASGQSNMEQALANTDGSKKAIADSANPNIRLFTVKTTASATPQTDVPREGNKGKWLECGPETVPGFSAVAYYFARDLQKALNVPVGVIHTSWGGTAAEEWTSMDVLKANPAHLGKHGRQSQLYNGMIAPLIPYRIAGALWYQGESNAGRADLYAELMGLMIKNWRDDWKQGDFPFLFVQLAPFLDIGNKPNDPEWVKRREMHLTTPTDTNWAHLREAQLHTLKVKNTGMAVITDVGDETDIHPRRKEQVGARLALAARAIGYGEKIEFAGPMYDKMTVDGKRAVVSFTHLGKGLEAKGGELTGFTSAGEDKVFHNAKAEIKGDTVVVWSDAVEKPVAVRFGWANFPIVNLFNKDGLPATPFRTDAWPRAAAVKPK